METAVTERFRRVAHAKPQEPRNETVLNARRHETPRSGLGDVFISQVEVAFVWAPAKVRLDAAYLLAPPRVDVLTKTAAAASLRDRSGGGSPRAATTGGVGRFTASV
jgi:hypothetical protein